MIDKRTLSRLTALRQSLAAADGERDGSFSEVFHAFLDIAEDPALLQGSKRTKNPLLKGTLERLAGRLADDERAQLENVTMLGIADAGFVHGGFFVGGKMGSFFFVKEEQGLLAIRQEGAVLYSRITITKLPPGSVPMRGPEGMQ